MKLAIVFLSTLAVLPGCAQVASQAPQHGVGNTSWQLVRFQGGDDTILTSDERSKYAIAFADGGGLSVRFDCNRGRGTWTSRGPGEIEFGPLALTRAMCAPGSLHDHIVRQWPFVRSCTIKVGHLLVSLMADGATFEFEPLPR
jgi:para-nitrobenzyl esterase